MDRRYAVFITSLFLVGQITLVQLNICSNTVDLLSLRLDPSVFHGVASVRPLPPCVRESIGIVCEPPTVLADNNTGPQQPDLNNDNDVRQFVAWSTSNPNMYLTLLPRSSPAVVSTIDIYLLNNPRSGISVPNFELHALELSVVTNIPAETDPVIPFDITNNNGLSLEDNVVRRITLRIRNPASYRAYLLRWNFDNLLNVSWFLMSEISLCNDQLPNYETNSISFIAPVNDTTLIIPQSEFLMNGSIILTCTVANEGEFMWQWSNGPRQILDSDPGTSILSADGTRTSVLQTPVSSSDSSFRYSCSASFTITTSYFPRSFEISLPPSMRTSATVFTGHLDESSITLLCQVRGYFGIQITSSWKRGDETLTNSSSKYSTGYSQELVSSNSGFELIKVTLSLTILDLVSGDAGDYTCVINSSQVETYAVTLVATTLPRESTGPPGGSALTPSVTTSFTEGGNIGTANSGNPDLVVGIIVALVVVSIVLVAAILFVIIFIRRYRKSKAWPKNQHRLSHTYDNGEVECQTRINKADIKWDVPMVNGVDNENKIDGLYASISKDRPPSLPSRHYTDDVQQEDNFPTNEYAEIRGRRMTNSTAPKLAKLKRPASFGLTNQDQNPIYESSAGISTSDSKEHLLRSSPSASDDSGLYALPNVKKKEPEVAVDESSSNIYSEALTPAMFRQTDSAPDSNLSPYGPIYAEPTMALKHSNTIKKITLSNFREVGHLGVGQFGEVILAETVGLSEQCLGLSSNTNQKVAIKVAIKKLQKDATASIRENFEKEITFMASLKDDNIIRMLAVGKGEDPFIMMEYMENGDLHQLLNDYTIISTDTTKETGKGHPIHISLLVYAALQISSGMKYLASRNCVHRDLATRNCLVNESFKVKIGDFGMSRKLYDRAYYKVRGRAMLPIRWMATESFYGRFSEKTDVWSFGVVVWEIFTLCRMQPYSDMDDQEFIKDAIKGGKRQLLECPKHCPNNVYDVMLRCWEEKSQYRATFNEICKMLSIIYQDF